MNKTNISRPHYLNKITPYMDKGVIKVIVGQRRTGKSFFLRQIIGKIKKSQKSANVIYINKELHEFDNILDYKDLVAYVENKSKKRTKNYLFVDEIQDIEHFEKALRSFNASGKYDIYCTGSNAVILSGELATYLSGRYVEIPMYSLSYGEFLDFKQLGDSQEALEKYIRFGGMPNLINFELEEEIVYGFLRNIYSSIILRDVVARYGVRNINFLERLVEYLADNIGCLISSKKISDFLKSQRINISPNVVLNYLSFLSRAFFIIKVPRTDIQGKKVFEINEKYYFEDLGLRNSLVGFKAGDTNKILENLVFSRLKFLGYKIMVGQLDKKEVDFVAEKDGSRTYIQVAYLIKDEETRNREFGNLLDIPDNYRKLVVSMDELAGGEYKGIKHLNIRNFLTRFK